MIKKYFRLFIIAVTKCKLYNKERKGDTMKKITDKGQLIYSFVMTLGLFLFFFLDIFIKRNDGSKYSFYEMMSRISPSGIVLWICTFFMIIFVFILSMIQSFITHKKDAYTIIKQSTCIVMMIILAIEIKCVNKVTLAYAHIDNLHYRAVIVYACIYPIGLYVCDYIHSVLTAK